MPDTIPPFPQTVPALVQQDAPSVLPFHHRHPSIPILTRSSPQYPSVHQEYNVWNTAQPLAIIFPSNVLDLISAVKFCTSQKPPLPMTIRGGGHDAYGRNALAGAVQLDLRLMKFVHISKPASDSLQGTVVVTIGPGITGIEMQQALAPAGFAAPTGWVGTVGVTGWACGGGYGLETGMWGLGVDNIMGAKLVLPSGEIFDTIDDPELLWALRGAGLGNFGVICELRLKAYPNPRYLAGFLAFPLAEGESVMGGLQKLDDQGLPDHFSGEFTLNTTSLGSTINIMFAWTCQTPSEVTMGWEFLERLKTLGTVLLNTVSESETFQFRFCLVPTHGPTFAAALTEITPIASVLKHHELIHANPDFNARGYTTMHSMAVPRLSKELIRILMLRPAPIGGTSCVLFHHAHGKALQSNPNAAWAHRDRHYICTPCGFAGLDSTTEERQSSKLWADDLFQAIQRAGQCLEKGYWSMSRPEQCDAIKYFGPETVLRLRNLRSRYNPGGHFPMASPFLGDPEGPFIANSKI